VVDIVLLGAPGAGKGTQAELLRDRLSLPSVSSGDLFRAALSERTPLGLRAKAYMDKGELVPDEITVSMVAERISQKDCAAGVIFDGFPRTAGQAEELDNLFDQMQRRVDIVLYVMVSEGVLLRRLAGRWTCRECGAIYHREFSPEKVQGVCDACGGELYQRPDDTPETQKRRIQVYLQQTAPLEAYYRGKGLLVELDGEQEIDVVQGDIVKAIGAVTTGRAC